LETSEESNAHPLSREIDIMVDDLEPVEEELQIGVNHLSGETAIWTTVDDAFISYPIMEKFRVEAIAFAQRLGVTLKGLDELTASDSAIPSGYILTWIIEGEYTGDEVDLAYFEV
jgi:hypothetical protein